MLVKFTTKSYPDIVMFGDVANQLFNFMGHSGTIPGAILADDLPEYLVRLKNSLSNIIEEEITDNKQTDIDEEPVISLKNRAQPLIELFESAIENKNTVTWEQG